MSTDKEYNGWTNYETWLVALWIDNDEGLMEYVRELTKQSYEEPNENRFMGIEARRKSTLADTLKEWFNEMNPLGDEASVLSDLITSALSKVDWYDIAESYLADYQPEEEEVESDS